MTTTRQRSVRTELLNAAQKLIQQRGYNAISYADLARLVGVKTASIHYYFPTKADLATAVMERYTVQMLQTLEQIAADVSAPSIRLARFMALFVATAQDDGQICLGAMLAADLLTLAPPTQTAVQSFFAQVEAWLALVLHEGRAAQQFTFADPPATVARRILALLEGSLLVGRTVADVGRLQESITFIHHMVGGTPS